MFKNPYEPPRKIDSKCANSRRFSLQVVVTYLAASQFVFWSQISVISVVYDVKWSIASKLYVFLISIFQTAAILAWNYTKNSALLWLPMVTSIILVSILLRHEFMIAEGDIVRIIIMLSVVFGFCCCVALHFETSRQ